MMNAYDIKYLDDSMKNLGEAFDYAVNAVGMSADEYMDLFIATGVSDQFLKGNPKYVCGLSGTELVNEVLNKSGVKKEIPGSIVDYECSEEYWSGWILAYYQWKTGKSFKDIHKSISMSDIIRLYPTLHEAAEDKFVDVMNVRISKEKPQTKLQMMRRLLGYSQKYLSEKSGVSLRMIQQYEQRAKDINKATGSNLTALAYTLGCDVESLMEDNIYNM